MPPFVIPIIQAVAAAFTVDSLRSSARRWVPRPAPPPLELGGPPLRPPARIPARTYPLMARMARGDRRR